MEGLRKPTIAVDFDDVLCDTNEGLARFHNNRYGTSYEKKDVQHTSLEKVWGCTTPEVIDRFREYLDSPYHEDAPPVEGSQEALRILSEKYTPIVITARSSFGRTVTQSWLNRNFPSTFKRGNVYLLGVRENSFGIVKPKSDICKERNVFAFIDDGVSHIERAHAAGILSLLFDQPWNRSHDTNGSAIKRVHSWDDILTILQGRGR